jgi:hypothetical protein
MFIQAICNAILNVSQVIDNENSTEVKLIQAITSDGNKDYDLEEVDSTARHILIALIHRCIVGSREFRARKKAKQEDLISNCLTRVQDVIATLWLAKTVCRDVLVEEEKIALLVNQPKTMLDTKKGYKKANDTKKNTADKNKTNAEEYKKLLTKTAQQQAAGPHVNGQLSQAHLLAPSQPQGMGGQLSNTMQTTTHPQQQSMGPVSADLMTTAVPPDRRPMRTSPQSPSTSALQAQRNPIPRVHIETGSPDNMYSSKSGTLLLPVSDESHQALPRFPEAEEGLVSR